MKAASPRGACWRRQRASRLSPKGMFAADMIRALLPSRDLAHHQQLELQAMRASIPVV